MPNLVIDIGNTHSKFAVFNKQELLKFDVVDELDEAYLIGLIEAHDIKNAAISSVGEDPEILIAVLKKKVNFIPFNTSITTGIVSKYKTPSTLGLDRWAKVVGANKLYQGINCLIIDSGTCITYDLLTAGGVYEGGSISPGIRMRFKALNNYTERLPLIDWPQETVIPVGDTTADAIKSGVLQGYVNEVAGFIGIYNTKYKELKVLIAGGDAEFLSAQLKNSIFAPQIINEPLLVLKGLNEVITLETCT